MASMVQASLHSKSIDRSVPRRVSLPSPEGEGPNEWSTDHSRRSCANGSNVAEGRVATICADRAVESG